MAKWTIKLNEFDIQYRLRPWMKVQVLTDFVAECIIPDNNLEDESNDKIKPVETPKLDLASTWVLHIDGTSHAQDSGAGLILTNFEEIVTEYALRFNFKTLFKPSMKLF